MAHTYDDDAEVETLFKADDVDNGQESTLLFNKELFFKNVDVLFKKNDMKISNFEKSVGLSRGLLSRYRKGTVASNPDIEIILKLAKGLGVPAHFLYSVDLSDVSVSEGCVIDFLIKMAELTCNGQMYWGVDRLSKLQEVSTYLDREYQVVRARHPLFVPGDKVKSGDDYRCPARYNSLFFPRSDIRPYDDFYHAATDDRHVRFYLATCVEGEVDFGRFEDGFYEMYMVDDTFDDVVVKKVCCTRNSSSALNNAMDELVTSINRANEKIYLDSRVMDVIEEIMRR